MVRQGFWRQGAPCAILAIAAFLTASGSAQADPVIYSTSGPTTTFLFGLGEVAIVSFNGVTSATLPSTPGDVSLGTFTWISPGIGFGNPSEDFNLTVTQSQPVASPSNGTLFGELSARLRIFSADRVEVAFSNTVITIGSVTYRLETMNAPGVYTFVAPNQSINLDRGGTTLFARVTATPEPSTMAMAFGGAVVFAGTWWRRRRAA